MTLPDPVHVIAGGGTEELPYDTADFLAEMLEGAYPDGVVLEYHGLQLYSRCHYEEGVRIFDVYTADYVYLETLNLGAFRSVTEIQHTLDEIVGYDPADRDEWVNR